MRKNGASVPRVSNRVTRADCTRMDRDDPLKALRRRFVLPEDVIYLDGNSLGPMPKSVVKRLDQVRDREWAEGLIRSWNAAGWFGLTRVVGDKIARLIGAPKGSVVAGDTISVNLFKLLGAAIQLVPDRRIILSDSGNFPSDLYVADGLVKLLGRGYRLKVVEPEAVADAIDRDVAVLMLTEVDYRSGRLHDMKALTKKAHAAGAITVWDLAHTAGATAVDLEGAKADMAHGCTYKYLNGGPGAPAFLYVRPDLQGRITSPIAGWWGHARPFAFDLGYEPAPDITRMQCGTQPILSLAALDTALDVWEGVDMRMVREKSKRLTALFAGLVEERCAGHGLSLVGPRDPDARGSQVSFRCKEAYAVMQALIAEGIIGDFRAPDMIRFGFAPLYVRHVDVWDAAAALARVLADRLWDRPRFKARHVVT